MMSLFGITAGTGVVHVAAGGPFGWALRWLNRLPLRGADHPVRLDIKPGYPLGTDEEVWTRWFGDGAGKIRPLQSRFAPGVDGTFRESWGPLTFVFEATAQPSADSFTLRLCHAELGVVPRHPGRWRIDRRWLSIQATIEAMTTGGSRTAVEILAWGGSAGTLRYAIELDSEVRP